jgi:hypothetical protein
MRPKTLELLRKVKKLWRKRKRQKEIGRILGLSRSTVLRYQRLLGVPAWQPLSPAQERKILEMLDRRRWGASRIAKYLDVSEYRVVQLMAKHGFHRRRGEVGYKWDPTKAQLIQIIDLALSHNDSVASIARKVGGPYKPVLRICHVALDCQKFLSGGQGKLGLDSYFPSRFRSPIKKEATAGTPLDLVAFVHRAWDGQLPTAILLNVCIEVALAILRREREVTTIELKKITDHFQTEFSDAITTLRQGEAAQSAWVN